MQARLVIHPLTAPILGNDHNDFRGRESSVREVHYYTDLVFSLTVKVRVLYDFSFFF